MKSLTKSASLLFVIILCAFFTAAQQPVPVPPPPVAATNNVQLVIEGKVINVHDGDTVTVLDQNNKKYNIRLHGIDAPELKQAFGAESQENLSRMVLGKQVSIFWNKVDKYRRTVGTIKIDDRDINIEQVKAGLAWHFKKYQDEQEPEDRVAYAAAEEQAHLAELGLWKQKPPTAPGDYRQAVKAKRWGPPPPEGTIIGTRNSKKYHRPDCEGYRNMAERNRVFFKTVAEAEAAGYKRAGNCPEQIQVANVSPVVGVPIASPVAATQAVNTGPSSLPMPSTQPAPLTPEASTNRNGSLVADEAIVGNSNSKKYHRPGCPGYKATSEKNRVLFKTVAEAEAAGYTRAGNCPAEDETAQDEKPANVPTPTSATPPQVVTPAATAPSVATSPSTSLPPTPPSPVSVPDAKAAVAAVAAALPVDEKIIGNINSKKYHRVGCPGYKSTSEKNRVFFKTAAEAEAAGYKRAGNCPAEDEVAKTEPPANVVSASTATPPQVVTPAATAPSVATSSSTSLPPTPPSPVPLVTTPESSAATPATSETTTSEGKIIGNKNSKVYHLPGCASYGRVSEKNQVLFDTVADAEKAGFRIAANCSAKPKE